MKIETRFDVGDHVWGILNGKPKQLLISSINIEINYNSNLFKNLVTYKFKFTDTTLYEEDVHITKEELLNYLSQWS